MECPEPDCPSVCPSPCKEEGLPVPFVPGEELLLIALALGLWTLLVVSCASWVIVSTIKKHEGRRAQAASLPRRDEAEAWWSGLSPGTFVVLTFEGDSVKHEMLLTWREEFGPLGSLYTPDGDHYALRLQGDDADAEVEVLDPIGEVYRFRRVPSEAVSRRLFRLFMQGRALVEAEMRAEGRSTKELPDALEVLLPSGRRELFVGIAGERTEPRGPSPAGASGGDILRATSPAGAAPEGFVWLCDDPRADGPGLGEILDPGPESVKVSAADGLCKVDGVWCRERLVSAEAIGAAVRGRRRHLSQLISEAPPAVQTDDSADALRSRLLGEGAPAEDAAVPEVPTVGDDARTLAVDYDGQGERQKPWRLGCREMKEVPFEDWPLEGPRTVLHLAKHMERHGKTPSAFLERWARSKRVEDSDRVYHELPTLIDSLELLVTYDQVNIANLAGVEVMARRLQTVFDAYELNPRRSNFEAAKYFSGMGSATDAVAPELRSFVARKARDDAEVEKQRQKVRELRGKAPPGGAPKPGS